MLLPISLTAATLAFVATCWVTDVRTRQIPNVLSCSACVLGLLLNLMVFGLLGLLYSMAGVVVATLFLLGPFALGGIGGGDVKMMGAIGALLGPLLVLQALVVGFTLGGLVMVVHLAGLGRLREKLTSTARMLTGAWAERSIVPLRLADNDAAAVTLPYSVPLGLGTVAALLPRMGILEPLF